VFLEPPIYMALGVLEQRPVAHLFVPFCVLFWDTKWHFRVILNEQGKGLYLTPNPLTQDAFTCASGKSEAATRCGWTGEIGCIGCDSVLITGPSYGQRITETRCSNSRDSLLELVGFFVPSFP
jgi:hypothetical protein